MKIRTGLLILFIVSLIFLVRSPSLAADSVLDPGPLTPIPINAVQGYMYDESCFISDTEYADPSLYVLIEQDRYLDTDIWIARVRIAHPGQLRSAYAGRYGTQTITPAATIAKRVNAVVAINAANYSFDNQGIALLQGHLYRNRPNGDEDILIIDENGDFHILFHAGKESFKDAYDARGGAWEDGGSIINIITFGPALVVGGAHAHETYYRYNTGVNVAAQRMVIAQTGPLSYLLVTCEGPESPNSVGLTVQQMADYMVELGCETAYNLDGGSSSTLVFRNAKINSLDTRKVRPVADIIYFSSGIDHGR
jgi:exopolysaccharide biosynthesis protein